MTRGWFSRIAALYDLLVILFLLTAVAGALTGYDPRAAVPALLFLCAGGVLYALVKTCARRDGWENGVALSFTLPGGLTALYFISQVGRMPGEDKIELITRIGAWITSWTPDLLFWPMLPNSLATFLEGLVFVAAGLCFASGRRLWRWTGAGLAALMLGALALSGSRGAWLAVLVAGFVWLAARWRPARWAALGAAVGALGLVVWVSGQGSLDAVNRIPVLSNVLGPLFFRPDRLEVISNSLALAREFPFTGIGLGPQFGFTYSRYELLIEPVYLSYPHQLFLGIWLGQGAAGLCVWAALLASVLLHSLRGPGGKAGLFFEASWAGILAIVLHGLTDARMVEDGWCWLPFFALLGLNAGLLERAPLRLPARLRLAAPAGAAILTALVVVGLAGPLPAAWWSNLGALAQQKANLSAGLDAGQRAELSNAAEAYFLRALESAPRLHAANFHLGLLYIDDLRVEKAEEVLQTAYTVRPEHPATRKALGLASALNQNTDQAARLLEGFPAIADELVTWANYLAERGEYRLSIGALNTALRFMPASPVIQERITQLEAMLP